MPQYGLLSTLALTLALSSSGTVYAQTAQAPKPAPSPVQPGTPGTPAAAPVGAAPAGAGADVDPPLPQVDDPMLDVPPPPPRVLRSWQEGLALVRRNSTALRSNRALIRQAEAESRLALSPSLPSLTAGAGVTHHLLKGEVAVANDDGSTRRATIPDPATIFNAGASLRVPILAPRAWYDRGTALDAVESTKLNAREVERIELGTLANTIVTVVTAERLAEVSRVSLRSALASLDLNRRRAELGAASSVDVLRAQQEVEASRAQVIAADENVLSARETLGLSLGSTDPYGVTPEIRIDALASDAKASCTPERTIASRPDVRAQVSRVRVAERSANAISYDYFPTLDAVSDLDYFSTTRATANGEHVTWTIGGVLTWVLYDGGSRYATRSIREAQVAQERERLTDTERRATLEVSQSVRRVGTAEANLVISRAARDVAREQSRLTRIAYLNGSGTSFDLVDAARRLREAELDLAIREFEVLRAKITALLALATCRI